MNEMEVNYKIDQEVVVSGILTGVNDVMGIITEVEYNSLSQDIFYLVKSTTTSHWNQECYLKTEA